MTEIIETPGGIECRMCGVLNWPTAMACMNCNAALRKQYGRDAVRREMSFSQKVARFFEISDYILLLPATLGLLYSLMLFPVLPLIIGCWYTLGCLLLRGFYKHSRNRLSSNEAIALWVCTFGYNLIELLVIASGTGVRMKVLYVWPLLVMLLSVAALRSDLQERKAIAV